MKDDKIQWHPGFYAAMRMELNANKNDLVFCEELPLGKKPLQVDLFIIKKLSDKAIKNPIGHIFRQYNLMEYKSPGASMNIDTFYKVNAYACLFKCSGGKVDEYKASEITITLVRKTYPRELIKSLNDSGYYIERTGEGIYHVKGSLLFQTQIIVSGELNYKEHIWLGALTQGIQPKKFEVLMEAVQELKQSDKYADADAVLEVVTRANIDIVKKWKESVGMSATLEKLIRPELEKLVQSKVETKLEHERMEARKEGLLEGRQEGRLEGITLAKDILRLDNAGYSLEEIASKLDVEEEVIKRILE